MTTKLEDDLYSGTTVMVVKRYICMDLDMDMVESRNLNNRWLCKRIAIEWENWNGDKLDIRCSYL